MLKLMYITNNIDIAHIAESSGVERVFIDMEYIGKNIRQCGMDTVKNHHTIEDIKRMRQALKTAELMVRCNPIHEKTAEYCSSEEEIDDIIEAGADIIMLPYFKTVEEVKRFLNRVNKRIKTILLVETPEAVKCIDEILSLDGVEEVFVGLNDMSLGYGKKFMFELLADGTVESLCLKFRLKGVPYGFGGIASLGKGLLPSEYVIREHYRLGSTCAILSRSFCNANVIENIDTVREIFTNGIKEIRNFEKQCEDYISYFTESRNELVHIVRQIAER
jgi:hypothetical protein